MIVHVRQVDNLFFIAEEISRAVEWIQLIPFAISISYDDAILVSYFLSSNFIFSETRDIDISLMIYTENKNGIIRNQ